MIKEIETAIIAHLQPIGVECNTRITAANGLELFKPVTANEVFVLYSGANFSPPQYLDPIVQLLEVEFEIVSRIQDLRSGNTLYPLLEAIRRRLTGFVPIPETIKPLVQVGRERFNDRLIANGIWAYAQFFRLTIEFTQEDNT